MIDDFNADVVAVFGSDHVYRMDVNQMLAFHQESGADATIAARPVPLADARQFGVLAVDRVGRVVQFDEKPEKPAALPDDPTRALVSMGNYIFSRQPLIDALVADARRSTDHDFGRSIIPELVLVAGATHPFADWRVQEIYPDDRYKRVVEDLQLVARANLIFGLHVHVGVEDREAAIRLMGMDRMEIKDKAHMLAMAKELFDLVLAGKIRGEPNQSFALADAAEAHRALEARKTVGATVLVP